MICFIAPKNIKVNITKYKHHSDKDKNHYNKVITYAPCLVKACFIRPGVEPAISDQMPAVQFSYIKMLSLLCFCNCILCCKVNVTHEIKTHTTFVELETFLYVDLTRETRVLIYDYMLVGFPVTFNHSLVFFVLRLREMRF